MLFPKLPKTQELKKTLVRRKVVKLEPHHITSFGTPSAPQAHWATVSAFKGLESDVVVLVGIEQLDSNWWSSVLYVGMSRARVRLHLVIDESARADVARMHANYTKKIVREVEID